jgi:hypothetical protein
MAASISLADTFTGASSLFNETMRRRTSCVSADKMPLSMQAWMSLLARSLPSLAALSFTHPESLTMTA